MSFATCSDSGLSHSSAAACPRPFSGAAAHPAAGESFSRAQGRRRRSHSRGTSATTESPCSHRPSRDVKDCVARACFGEADRLSCLPRQRPLGRTSLTKVTRGQARVPKAKAFTGQHSSVACWASSLAQRREQFEGLASYIQIYRYTAVCPVDPTGRFAAVEFHYFMHMRVKTICRF